MFSSNKHFILPQYEQVGNKTHKHTIVKQEVNNL